MLLGTWQKNNLSMEIYDYQTLCSEKMILQHPSFWISIGQALKTQLNTLKLILQLGDHLVHSLLESSLPTMTVK